MREAWGRGCRKQAVEPSGEQRQFGGTLRGHGCKPRGFLE